MRYFLGGTALGLMLCLAPGLAWADDPAPTPTATPSGTPAVSPINTNRPTQGTNTAVVGPGVFQLETGLNEQSFKGGGASLFQFVSQFRFGLGKSTEIAVTNPLYNSQAGNTGIGDSTVSFKYDYATIKAKDSNTVLAVVGNYTIPSGAGAFRNAGAVEQIIFAADIPTGKNSQNLTLDIAPTSVQDPVNGQRFTQIFYAAYETIPVSSTASAFFEISGFGPDASVGGINQTNADAGMSFLLSTETQVDFDILKGLSQRGTDWFFTVGLSHRFK